MSEEMDEPTVEELLELYPNLKAYVKELEDYAELADNMKNEQPEVINNSCTDSNEDDWKKLEKNIITKDTEWKKKAIYCFEGEHPEELPILLSIIDTEDFELFEMCVDSLRFMITDDNRQRILCNNGLLIKMKKEADRGISGKIFLDCITKLNQDFN